MTKENFEGLLESVKEAGQILRGEKKPSREFLIEVPDIKPPRKEGFALCVETDDIELLIPAKVYRVWFLRGGRSRVIDEAGEATIYPPEFFMQVEFPVEVKNVLENLQKAA